MKVKKIEEWKQNSTTQTGYINGKVVATIEKVVSGNRVTLQTITGKKIHVLPQGTRKTLQAFAEELFQKDIESYFGVNHIVNQYAWKFKKNVEFSRPVKDCKDDIYVMNALKEKIPPEYFESVIAYMSNVDFKAHCTLWVPLIKRLLK